MIAALYVQRNGCYWNAPGIDAWDEERDARLYAGPWPVVAHPPCERWGRYWDGGPAARGRHQRGDDGGCFAAALASVRRWGGVLEHPAQSYAWAAHRLASPPETGGWVRADWCDGFYGWTCQIEQGSYGHRARKATWLYAHGVMPPPMLWGRAPGDFLNLPPDATDAQIRWATKVGMCQRLSRRARAATPVAFRDCLISIALSAVPSREDRPADPAVMPRSGVAAPVVKFAVPVCTLTSFAKEIGR